MITYLSLGAGVDTTAISLMPDVMEKVDFVIFADTGGENPETYDYIDRYLKPHFEKIHKPFIVVTGKEGGKVTAKSCPIPSRIGQKTGGPPR